MAANVEQVQIEHVACEICLKEVPTSEAVVSEAADYVTYFCGLDCYGKWKDRGDRTAEQDSRPSAGVRATGA